MRAASIAGSVTQHQLQDGKSSKKKKWPRYRRRVRLQKLNFTPLNKSTYILLLFNNMLHIYDFAQVKGKSNALPRGLLFIFFVQQMSFD